MNAAEMLQQLNALDEHPRLEAKAGGGMSEDVLRTVCAFTNEPGLGGGWIIFGVRRDEQTPDSPYEVCGVQNLDALQQNLLSQAGGVFNQPVRPQVTVETLAGRPVLVAFIAEQPAASKPIFFKKAGLPKGAYRRIGSADVACTDDDLTALYGGRITATHDASIVEAGLDAIDGDAVRAYRAARQGIQADAPELRWNDTELLEALHCAVRTAGAWHLTLAGLVLFGSDRTQRRLMPMQRVDYVRVPGRQWAEHPEQPYQTNELRGPLLTLIPRLHDLILSDVPIAAQFPNGAVQRSDVPLIPGRVIREAVVNALMHRSWRIHGPVQIIRYANRLEIANPGHSLKLTDQLGEPGSRPRNPLIAAVLHETRFAETKGSGIRVMRELLRAAGLSAPSFDSDRDADQFTATFLFHHFLDDADLAWFQRLGVSDLGSDEMRALILVREKGAISNADLRELTGLDTLGASQCLRRLRNRNLIVQRERSSATFYTAHPTLVFQPVKLMNPLAHGRSGEPPMAGEKPPMAGEKPPMAGEKPPMAAPPGLAGNEWDTNLQPAALVQGREDLPAELRQAVERLKGHAPAPILAEVIEALCQWRELTRAELALVLGRAPDYLRSHLKALVDAGRLELRHPGEPRHPHQAYRAARGKTSAP